MYGRGKGFGSDEVSGETFAVEGQGETHYAMPVREMVYDAMNYAGQVKALSDKHRKRKDYRDGAEFLSGLLREDRLAPDNFRTDLSMFFLYWA